VEKTNSSLMDTKNDLHTRNLQLSKFNDRYDEMTERDLVLFVCNGNEVFDIIDQMPMRRLEMKNR
jgi:hypothetical protein